MNIKILFSGLIVFIFSPSNILFGQCDNIIINYQSEIDNFAIQYPGCTEISGIFKIEETVAGNITNLNGLSQINKVKNLLIFNNSSLTNLNGLNNITAISNDVSYGRLQIINNASLVNIDALENIQEILQQIMIVGNPQLTSINGLHNVSITHPDLGITIEENPLLQNLLGLNQITLAKYLSLQNNDMLINLNGLNNLTELGRLTIAANQNLINCEGLNNLVTVGGDFGIDISGNPSLESFDGFESLVSSSRFHLAENTAVTSVEGFSSLTSSLNGFGIGNSPLLTSLSGLENLTNVFLLYLEGNDLLNDISALSNVNINTPLYELVIQGSPELAICDYPNICQYLNNPSNIAYIYDNAPGCNSREEVLQACGLLNINDTNTADNFSIHPNPTKEIFTISGIDNGTIQITDSQGRILKTFTLGKDETSLEGLSEGVYFINITNEKGSVTKQLIKI